MGKQSPDALMGGLAELADNYECFIVDLWGVMHDGVTAFPDSVACLKELKAAGKTVVLLSNSPRRTDLLRSRLTGLGIAPELYDHIHSSGQEAYLTAAEGDGRANWGERYYDIGGDRFAGLLDGTDLRRVATVEEASFLLGSGPAGKGDQPEDYDSVLRQGIANDLLLVCANPDLVVVEGGERHICAGSIAARYEALGGAVHYLGKPHRAVYDRCLRLAGDPDPSRVLAIGDSLHTDIRGANTVGIDSVLILNGIHGPELDTDRVEDVQERLATLSGQYKATPTAPMRRLQWLGPSTSDRDPL